MKRLFALLLCAILFFGIGCKKEEPSGDQSLQTPPEGEWGEFYTEGNYVLNTLITAEMNTAELTAPVTELSYSLLDNCDFGVAVTYYTEMNDGRTHRLEILRNGKWEQAPRNSGYMTEMSLVVLPDADPGAHRRHDITMKLKNARYGEEIYYAPLEKGEYRLIVTYELNTDQKGVEIPKGNHAAILYFTVV